MWLPIPSLVTQYESQFIPTGSDAVVQDSIPSHVSTTDKGLSNRRNPSAASQGKGVADGVNRI
jgi:hypothetical protein